MSTETPGAEAPLPATQALDTWDLPTFDATLTRSPTQVPELPPGRRVGPYRIESILGYGGMGAVYLAVRDDDTYEKRVAIKVTRGALASPDAVERFKRERQILARLEHPNIARLLDGGATEDGLPYFVMEHIEGRPIHAYCDAGRLDTRARLRLFLDVCAAVAYAHHNLIVHRDIKPGNILVTALGVPRLLDFGIAKLVDLDAPDKATEATSLAFTPFYASPEQVQGEPMTTATDVYSLGVLLYEMLTGHGPYLLASLAPLAVMRAIVEQEPEPPSAAVDRTVRYSTSDGRGQAALTPLSVSLAREGTPERLRHRLRGDLDAILMTALRKDASRRYATVEAFAEDIRRTLSGRPVRARPDRLLYRAGKFLGRNRWGVAAAVALSVATAGGAASFVVQSRRVARERDRAERVSRFLIDLFTIAAPGEARANSITAREVLDKGAERIERDLEEQPEVRADLMETMANKGDLHGAEAAYHEALERRRPLHGNESAEVAESLNNLASVLDTQGRLDESLKMLEESLAIKRKVLGPEDPRVATTLANIGVNRYKRGDLAGSEARMKEALALQRRVLGDDHPDVAFSLQALGVLEDEQGRYAEAEAAYREALVRQRKVLGQEHPDVVTTLTNLGNTLAHAGRLAEAAAILAEALPMSRKAFGADSTDTAAVLVGLADVERQRGSLQEAEGKAREGLSLREQKLGPDHPDTAEARVLLGEVLLAVGRLDEAEDLLERGLRDLESAPSLESRRRVAREALRKLHEAQGRTGEPPGPGS